MNKISFLCQRFVLTALAILSLSAAAATASVINVTVDPSGLLYHGVGIATGDDYAQGNNNPESNLAFLQTVLGNYNTFNNPDLPAAVGPVGVNHGSLGDIDSYTSIGGYDYVVFHFGAGPAAYGAPVWIPEVVVPPVYYTSGVKKGQIKKEGYTIAGHFDDAKLGKSSGGWWAAFYIGGIAGIQFDIPIPGATYGDYVYNGKQVGGFSSARYFNVHEDPPAVPDTSTSAVLLGLGFIFLGLCRRQIR